MRNTPLRSILKAISYRVAGTAATAVIVFFATKRWPLTLAAGGADAAIKLALYFVHERIWEKVGFGRRSTDPAVIWLTGLSGAGKTTLAAAVAAALSARGLKVEQLDGDVLRKLLPQTGFSREQRDAHVRRTALLARYLEKNGVFVVVALISPYEESRRFARGLCRNFIEVHVSTPLEICEGRDPSGLYARARRGELKGFTGIDDPYEAPVRPDVSVDTSRLSVDESVRLIFGAVERLL